LRLKREFDRKSNYEPKQYYSQDDVIQFLQSKSGPFRVDFRDDYYPKNSGEVFKLETINGYGATSLKQFYHFQAEAYPAGNVIADMMNVRYLVSQKGLDLPVAYQGQNAKVYENPKYMPRAWLTPRIEVKKDFSEMIPLLRDPGFNPYLVAYVEQPLAGLEPSPSPAPVGGSASIAAEGTAVFTQQSPNRFQVDTQSLAASLLVVSQNWYPGWKARVNGQLRRVERVNGALMGVQVGPGTSKVEFVYRPTRFLLAVMLALGAFAFLGFSLFKLRSNQN
jgi:hypothetical protein